MSPLVMFGKNRLFGLLKLLGLAVVAGLIVLMLPNDSCVWKVNNRTVRGASLSGLLDDGQQIKVWEGYYRCRPVRRNDIVAYRFAGKADPIVKVVKGLPGDSLALKQNGLFWRILINGRVAENAQGQPYVLDENQHQLLSLYVKDYGGLIPAGAYLILGNLPAGSLDSTQFGLVSQEDIAGKVKRK